jgi:hypothetical protein
VIAVIGNWRARLGRAALSPRRKKLSRAAGEQGRYLFEQAWQFDWLDVVFIAASRERLFAVPAIEWADSATIGMCRVSLADLRRRIASQPSITGRLRP